MKRREFIGRACGAAIGVSATGCLSNGESGESLSRMVSFDGVTWNPAGSIDALTGSVSNIGDRSLSTLELTAKLYDMDRELLDTCTMTIHDLAPGESSDLLMSYDIADKSRINSLDMKIGGEVAGNGPPLSFERP